MAAIALDASVSAEVFSSGLATRVRAVAAGAVVTATALVATPDRIKGLAATGLVSGTSITPTLTRARGIDTFNGLLLEIVGELNLADEQSLVPDIQGLIFSRVGFNGRLEFSTNGSDTEYPADPWTRVHWTGVSWDIEYAADGSRSTYWRSTDDVATPDLATTWTKLSSGLTTYPPGFFRKGLHCRSATTSADIGRIRPCDASGSIEAGVDSSDLTVRNNLLASTKFATVKETVSLDRLPPLAAILDITAVLEGSLSLSAPLASQVNPIEVEAFACLDPGRGALGACDVIREVLVLWGIENIDNAPGHARRSAMHYFNAGLQEVWNNAKDRNYWTRSTTEIDFASGEGSQTLADEVQNVIGPARISGQPLAPLGTRGDLDQYSDLFIDERDQNTYPLSGPVAYYVERLNQPGNEPAKSIIHIRPIAPDSGSTVELDVVLEAPRFTWADVSNCKVVPMPHTYVESLLLPIIRFKAMSHYLFIAETRSKSIEDAYLMAKGQLDQADPLPGKSGDNTNRREDPRA